MNAYFFIGAFVAGVALGSYAGLKVGDVRLQEYKNTQQAKVIEKIDVQTVVIETEVEKEVEKVIWRDRYIDRVRPIIKEVSVPLLSCPLPADAVSVWNRTAECALRPSQASCNSDAGVRGTGAPAE